ncbi:O-antigen translocase, partial [Proteus mirabilis]|nr:O-antigen translocase [Proteus mirabilis]
VLNNLLLSIINGLKEIRSYIKINIIQSLYSLLFTSLLIFFLGLKGALIALVTNQSIIFFITLYMLRKHKVIIWRNFLHHIDKNISKKLLSYSVMAITSAIMVPSSQFIIRNYIATTQGLEQAGYWQGVWYISTTYLMIVTTALSTYYLPRLSEIANKQELKKEIFQGYKILLPIAMGSGLIIYFLRDFIINILFSNTFSPMKPLFTWQIIGDIFKIASWLLAYVMLAKAMTKIFIISEIIFSSTFILFSFSMIKYFGTIGATYAYTINYILYFIFTFFFIYKKLFKNNE